MIQTRKETLINAVTATTTSNGVPMDNAGRASLMLVSSGISSGNGVFTVQVSNDGVNWVDYNRLITNVTNTNAQTDTKVASVTLSTNTTSMVFIPNSDTFASIRAKVVVTTDGTYSCVAYLN